MRITSFTLAMLTATIKAQEDEVVTYDNQLKCGKCINAGFNFCHTGTDGVAVADGGEDPTATCCEDGECE
jgi:hypothetical protein